MARRDTYIHHLARVPLFSQCSRAELNRLARRTTDINVPAGKTIVREQQGSYEFFVIVDGQAEVTRAGKKVGALGRGDFFGELGLLDRELRDATVTARTPMEIIVLELRDFEAALEESPRMTRKLLAGMARRLRELDKRS
jgi:CRP-like cAMP-binding protein